MALFNYATKEITLKVVYYGPGLCGKTTNLQHLHEAMTPEKKGKLLSLSTDADRTLFFDFMPIHLGKIKGFNVRFQLYTVPGQVRYNATRKLVLKGADAVVFVADSQKVMREANIESMQNMKDNLVANRLNPEEIPVVLQYNKRDLPSILNPEELDKDLNPDDDQVIEASAVSGVGVQETFQTVTRRLLQHISKKHNVAIDVPEEFREAEQRPVMAETAAKKKDTVKISVPDTSSPSLEELVLPEKAPAEEPEVAAAAFNEEEIEQSILRTSLPPEEEGEQGEEDESAWEGVPLDTVESETWEETEVQALPIHESTTADSTVDWEDAFDEAATGQDAAGQSELERVLAEEQREKPVPKAAATAVDSTSVISLLRSQLMEARRQQKLLSDSLARIEKILESLGGNSGT
jgi:small GTP-binding protein